MGSRKRTQRPWTRCVRRVLTVVVIAGLALPATSCGGASKTAANPMSLVEFLLVNQALEPAAPTGALSLPRNARLLMVFSELVNPASVTNQTVRVRYGPSFGTTPSGSFRTQGNTVIFDPTIDASGQPKPFGFQPVTQHQVTIPGFEADEPDAVVENLDFDPNTTTFSTNFTTGDGFLRELVAPEVLRIYFTPPRDDLTNNVPGDATMAIEFNEAMDPATLFLGAPAGPTLQTTIDVRFTNDPINAIASLDGKNVPGRVQISDDARTVFFIPTFSFGDNKYIFTTQVFQGVTDLAGNLLVNPRSFGPYTCDGDGRVFGKTIEEHFEATDDRDLTQTDASWAGTPGVLEAAPITSRQANFYTYLFTDSGTDSGRGEYAAFPVPLMGAAYALVNPSVAPPTSQGRRTLCSFLDTEIGPAGTITGAAWGPDSNQTRAAAYPRVILRCGYQADASLSLGPSFLGNYAGPPTIVYDGDYDVLQNSNVGNTPGQPMVPHVGGYPVAGPGTVCWPAGGMPNTSYNQPLFDFTGWYDWPAFTSFFDWDPGDPLVEGDSIFLFDASVEEGDTWQDIRGWFAVDMPCSTTQLTGQPLRNSVTIFESDQSLAGLPHTTLVDARFTVTRKTSRAQSLFYGPPTFPFPATGGDTYDVLTDYLTPEISPQIQANGASVIFEYQGATSIQDDRMTINAAQPFTDWTQNIDDCDGMPYIRWRATLTSNLVSGELPRVFSVVIPMVETTP